MNNLISIRVWGDFACFTRPEMKVERVSYPIITPSAARGILEAIFWEPEIYYLVEAIRVVKKGRWVPVRRNEVTTVVNVNIAEKWMRDTTKFAPILAGGGAIHGTQRNMLALEDVEYIITAEVRVSDVGRGSEQILPKYLGEVQRRAQQGKCFHRPSLGMREFAADFELESNPQMALERRAAEIRADKSWRNIWPEEDLGLMLYDVFDPTARSRGFRWLKSADAIRACNVNATSRARASKTMDKRIAVFEYEGQLASPQAIFFHARITDAKMECHPEKIRILRRAPTED